MKKPRYFFLALLIALPLVAAPLPELATFRFESAENKLIPGTSGEKERGFGCDGVIKDADSLGNLALVSLFYQNGCYTGDTYSHADFKVERGSLRSSTGGPAFDAYRVHPANRRATKFLASRHGLYYRFPEQGDWFVYRLSAAGDRQDRVASISSASIKSGEYTKIEGLTASDLENPAVFVFVPARESLSAFTRLGPGVEGARLQASRLGTVSKIRYAVPGEPADAGDTALTRRFFFTNSGGEQPAVAWQDPGSGAIYLTRPGAGALTQKTATLPNPGRFELVGATGDGSGTVYYLTVQNGSSAQANTARAGVLLKANVAGNLIGSSTLDCGPAGLNITAHSGNHASLAYSNGKLGLVIGRTMFRSGDGLNHQGAIAVVFDAATLRVIKNHGQTSGHSFDSFLFTDSDGDFLAIDLGDNYPRGINFHRFNEQARDSLVVYTFKTHHGTTPRSPAGRTYPPYPEISGAGRTYYKWSNDNGTYTELGGIVENTGKAEKSYTVVFAGEPYRGRSIDNSRIGENIRDARNLGLVEVRRDFEKASGGGNVVSDDLILTRGKSEEGGFYTFGGDWSAQRNTGVVWLTDYDDASEANVRHIKTIGHGDEIVILWEKWSANAYVQTYAMKVNASGKILTGATELGAQVRLNRRDDPFLLGDKILIASGSAKEKVLELVLIDLNP